MKTLILLGNTRSKSNTEALAGLFADELTAKGVEVSMIPLRDKDLKTCVGCDKCHSINDSYGCVIDDYMQEIAAKILESDLIVLSSPIYTWMPTPPLKAVMDRIFGFTKYPKDGAQFNLMTKQSFAMIATSGDECEKNCDLFDEAARRMAAFGKRPYLGCLTALDKGDDTAKKQEVIDAACAFAQKCVDAFNC